MADPRKEEFRRKKTHAPGKSNLVARLADETLSIPRKSGQIGETMDFSSNPPSALMAIQCGEARSTLPDHTTTKGPPTRVHHKGEQRARSTLPGDGVERARAAIIRGLRVLGFARIC